MAISQELRILDAKRAQRGLEPFEKSIWDATEFYIEKELDERDERQKDLSQVKRTDCSSSTAIKR